MKRAKTKGSVSESDTLPQVRWSASNNARNHHNLFRLRVERFHALRRLAGFNSESGSSSGALLRKDALSLADGGKRLGIANSNPLTIPGYAVVASPGHHS